MSCAFHHCINDSENILEARTEKESEEAANAHNSGIKFISKSSPSLSLKHKQKMKLNKLQMPTILVITFTSKSSPSLPSSEKINHISESR
jgi:hypothetical protein